MRHEGLLVAKSIVITENKCQVVSILNFDENPVKLKRYDVLDTAGPVSAIIHDYSLCGENLVRNQNICRY